MQITFWLGTAIFATLKVIWTVCCVAVRSWINVHSLFLVEQSKHRHETVHTDLVSTLNRLQTALTQVVQRFQATCQDVGCFDWILKTFGAQNVFNVGFDQCDHAEHGAQFDRNGRAQRLLVSIYGRNECKIAVYGDLFERFRLLQVADREKQKRKKKPLCHPSIGPNRTSFWAIGIWHSSTHWTKTNTSCLGFVVRQKDPTSRPFKTNLNWNIFES